jgi:hypothetical protein
VQANTGWALNLSPDVAPTPEPTPEPTPDELHIIRAYDPNGFWTR